MKTDRYDYETMTSKIYYDDASEVYISIKSDFLFSKKFIGYRTELVNYEIKIITLWYEDTLIHEN